MNLGDTAAPIELAWTSFGFVMFLICLVIFAESLLDLRVAYGYPPNTKHRLVALKGTWTQTGLLAVQVYASVLGVIALLSEPLPLLSEPLPLLSEPSTPLGQYTPLGVAFIVTLVLTEATVAGIAVGARYLRLRLDSVIDQEINSAVFDKVDAQHEQTMVALEQVKRAAQVAYKEANHVNAKIAATNVVAAERSEDLRRLLTERRDHEEGQHRREDEREERRKVREDERDQKIVDALLKQDDRRDQRERDHDR